MDAYPLSMVNRRVYTFSILVLVLCFVGKVTYAQDLDYFYSFLCPKEGSTVSHIDTRPDGSIVIGGQYHGSMDFDPGTGVRYSTSSVSTVSDHFVIHLNSDGTYRFHTVSDYRGFDNLKHLKFGKDGQLYKTIDYIYEKYYVLSGGLWNKQVTSENLNTRDFSCNYFEFAEDYVLVRGITPGNSMVIGQDTIVLPSSADVFVAKFDYNGNLLSDSVLYAPSSFSIIDVVTNKEGDIYFGGSYTNTTRISFNGTDTTLVSSGDKDALYGKLDDEGNLLWLTTLPQSRQYDEDVVSVGLDSSEHLYLITKPNALIANRMFKTDADGNVIWEKLVGNRPDNHVLHVLDNGDFYLKSRYYISGDMDPHPQGYYPVTTIYSQQYGNYLAKFSKDGDIIWGKRLYAAMNGSARVEIDKSENIYIAGSMDDWIVIDENETTTKTYKSPHPRLSAGYLFKWSPQECNVDENTDYYIKKTESDKGDIDSLDADVIPWMSYGIDKNNQPFDAAISNDSIPHKDNEYTVTITNRGCAERERVELETYFALPESQLKWPEDWLLSFKQVSGDSVRISDQLEKINMPQLLRNQTWRRTFNFKDIPSPMLFDKEQMNVNILARIQSKSDKMTNTETENIIQNVMGNNNIGWKVFTIK